MRIISVCTLREYWINHTGIEQALKTWAAEAKRSTWKTLADIKQRCRSADFHSDNRVDFYIKGNSYRLVVKIHYNTGIVTIRLVGTHTEYDKINSEKI